MNFPVAPHLETSCRGTRGAAFTLMEIMLVVGILAIVMAMGAPSFISAVRKEPMRKALLGVKDACDNARAQAILQGKTVRLVFHPLEGTFAVEGAAAAAQGQGTGMSGSIADSIIIEMLDVNLMEFRDAEQAPVRFFANGTTDEFTLILHSDRNEWRKLTLESTTGLIMVGDVR